VLPSLLGKSAPFQFAPPAGFALSSKRSSRTHLQVPHVFVAEIANGVVFRVRRDRQDWPCLYSMCSRRAPFPPSPGEYPVNLGASLSPYYAARPCSIDFLCWPSYSTFTLQLHQSCPYPPWSRVLSVPPLPARFPCFLSGQALSRWGRSSWAASVLRGPPLGPGFPLPGLPCVSCVPLPAEVSPWRVVFSALVISHARLRASSKTWGRPRASSGAAPPVVAKLWEQRVRLHGLGSFRLRAVFIRASRPEPQGH